MPARRLPPGVLPDLAALIPDCVTTVRRLRKDPRVPRRAKVAIVVAGIWVASPIDLIPEFIPVLGPLDDIVVVALALRYAGRQMPCEVILEAWTGDPGGVTVSREVLLAAPRVLPTTYLSANGRLARLRTRGRRRSLSGPFAVLCRAIVVEVPCHRGAIRYDMGLAIRIASPLNEIWPAGGSLRGSSLGPAAGLDPPTPCRASDPLKLSPR